MSGFGSQSCGTVPISLAQRNPGNIGYDAKIEDGKGKNRAWTLDEERALIQVLKMAISCGLKSENGWKASYKNYPWTEINKLLPGTDIQVQPHIMSKLKTWKREYACISSLRDKSGVGWESTEKIVKCSQDIWSSHAQAYSGMMKKKNTSWIFYDDWEYVFGKDSANGNGAKDVRDAAKKFVPDIIDKAKSKSNIGDAMGCSTSKFTEEDDVASSANIQKKAKTWKIAPMSEVDENFVSAISKVLNREKVEDPINILRSKIDASLIPFDLSDKDRLLVGRKLVHDEPAIHYFFSLSEKELELESLRAHRS